MVKKVLVVDDDRGWRRRHKNALEKEGFQVVTFSSMAAAKRAAARGGFDAFVVDGFVDIDHLDLLAGLATEGDGHTWAKSLAQKGKDVILCGSAPLMEAECPSGLKQVKKGRGSTAKVASLLK